MRSVRPSVACVFALLCLGARAAQAEPPAPQPTPPPPPGAPATTSTQTSEPPALATSPPPDIPLGSPTDVPEELDEGKLTLPNWFNVSKDEDPFKDVEEALAKLDREIGLKLGGAYTMLFQQASNGPGMRTAGSGDIDLLAAWRLIDKDGKNTGTLNASFEYRFQIGDQPPSALGGQIGSLIPTTNSFSERPPIVKELYWNQRLLDGALRLVAGRIDMENYVGGQRMQSANTFFLNKAFSGNPAVAFPSIGLGAGGAVLPVEWFYISGGVADANAHITQTGFNTAFDTGELFSFVEAGVLTDITDLGKGRQRLALWHIDARPAAGKPSDQGISVTLDQDFGEVVSAFVRTAYSDAGVTNVRWLVEGGVGFKGLIGTSGDYSGLGVAWASPPHGRAETIVEVFHRFQLSLRVQFTLGVQGIFNPTNSTEDAVAVFSARLRMTF